MNLQNATALITGGSSGIGKSLARSFLGAGANVTIVGQQAQLLQDAYEELKGVSGGVSALATSPQAARLPTSGRPARAGVFRR